MMKDLLKKIHLDRFIVFDTETTGLDPRNDRIIEFAATLFKDGEAQETLNFLCNPGVAISPEIARLTGISDEMVKDQLPFEERLDSVLEFFSDIPLIAHNIGFDLAFVKSYIRRAHKKHRLRNRLYDTVLLAQTFYFYLPDHKLTTVAEYCGLSIKGAHRAAEDTKNTGQIFLRLLERAAQYNLETVQTINMILRDSRDPNKYLYLDLARYLQQSGALGDSKIPRIEWQGRMNVVGGNDRKMPDSLTLQNSAKERAEFYFGHDGKLSRQLYQYEERQEQIRMAELIFDAIARRDSAMIEAGTGVGKSLAYLLPAIVQKQLEPDDLGRIAISSNTKTLQEQIFYKEIPFILEKLEIPFKAVLLKGRSNYICLTRWYRFLSDLPNRLHISKRSAVLPIVIWLVHTRTGDISENNGFKIHSHRYIWNEICSEPGYCTTSVCKKYGGCYLGKVREQAYDADVLVINHSLMLSDAAADNQVLPDYDILIIDEAHNLEKNAYNYFAARISLPRLRYLLNSVSTGTAPDRGILADAEMILRQLKKTDLNTQSEQVRESLEELRIQATAFFRRVAVEKSIEFSETQRRFGIRKRYKRFQNEFDRFQTDAADLLAKLAGFRDGLLRWFRKIEENFTQDPQLLADLRMTVRNTLSELELYQDQFSTITGEGDDELIFWYEIGSEGKDSSVELVFTPLNVSQKLAENLYEKRAATIQTSATIKIGNRFDYMQQRTGMNFIPEDALRLEAVGSPFHYSEQMRFITYHPERGQSVGLDASVSLLTILARETRRGILALFTSYSILKRIYQAALPQFQQLGIPLFAQSVGGSRTTLLERFRDSRESVLLGTMSFWEGVDVIGTALEILIIDKLPFAVPSEPIIEANVEKLKKEGYEPFLEYYVPESVLKFRQGVGRLIRSSTDAGVVINLDQRIDQKRYGRIFKESLPVEAETIIGESQLIRSVQQFFKTET